MWTVLHHCAAKQVLVAFSALVILGVPLLGQAAICTHPQGNVVMNPMGDINGSGAANVADTMCVVIASSRLLLGDPMPPCVSPAFALAGWGAFDLNCDGQVDVSDVTLLNLYALKAPLSPLIDSTGDGCPDACAPCVEPGERSCFIQATCIPEGNTKPGDNCRACIATQASGAWSLNDSASCDDGNPCTSGEACLGGSCVGGEPVVCAAPDACHDGGECDPGTGGCDPTPKVCDDGDPTTEDSCEVDVGCVFAPAFEECEGDIAAAPVAVACSTTHSDGTSGACANAFDGNTAANNHWHAQYGSYGPGGAATGIGQWIRSDHGGPKVFGGVRFLNATNNGHARDVVVEGANTEGGPWTSLHSATDVPHTKEAWVTLSFVNGTAYRYYRLRVTRVYVPALDAQNTSWLKLTEIEYLHGSADSNAAAMPAGNLCSSVHGDGQSGDCAAAFDLLTAHPNFWHSAYWRYAGGNALDGQGEWVTADFGSPTLLGQLRFINTSNNGHARDVVVEGAQLAGGPWIHLGGLTEAAHSNTAWVTVAWPKTTPYRYFRLRAPRVHSPALDAQSPSWVKFTEIEFAAGVGATAEVSASSVACSTTHSDGASGACAASIDGNTAGNNHWHSAYSSYGANGNAVGSGEWVRLDLGSPAVVAQVRLLNASNNGHARDVVVEGSASESGPFTVLASASNVPHTKTEWISLGATSQSPFRFLRVRVPRIYTPSLDSQNPSWLKLTEVQIDAVVGSSPCDPPPQPLSYTFTNAGATGRFGPSQAQVDLAYAGSPLQGAVTSLSGIQRWTVPTTGSWRVEARAAAGGNNVHSGVTTLGGKGAYVAGDFSLSAGTLLNVVVGQQGSIPNGGGGGSFVWRNGDPLPLLVAGGGGGAGGQGGSFVDTGKEGVTTTSGTSGKGGAAGGTNGSAGAAGGPYDPVQGLWGSGGGGSGWLQDAGGAYQAAQHSALKMGGRGGAGAGPEGGFGGGGSGWGAGGGGGGYSGGGGGRWAPGTGAGGGGSYNAGTNPLGLSGVGSGHGEVTLSLSVSSSPAPVVPASATCSTTHQGHACTNILDGNVSTRWHSAYSSYGPSGASTSTEGEWVRFDFGQGNAVSLKQARFINADQNGHIRDVVVEAAHSAAGPWTQVGAASDVGASHTWKVIPIFTLTQWRYYRLRVPRNYFTGPFDQQNHTWIKVSEADFLK